VRGQDRRVCVAQRLGPGDVIGDQQAEALRDADPAILAPHGLRAEISPMPRLVTPVGVYDA